MGPIIFRAVIWRTKRVEPIAAIDDETWFLVLTAKAARELARDGIAVNAVLPSVIEAEMLGEIARDAGALERLRATFPIGRFGRPEEVAKVVRFLYAEAPDYLTGEFIPLRGGRL